MTIAVIYVKYMYLYGNNAMQTANKVQSNIGSWLKSGKNAFVITALAAMQLFSACSKKIWCKNTGS